MNFFYPLLTMSFAYPLVLLLPFVFLFLFHWKGQSKSKGVPYPHVLHLKALRPTLRLRLRSPVLMTLSACCIIFLSLAGARPQKTSTVFAPQESRNLMLSIDLSGSMRAIDFRTGSGSISRLEGVKRVITEFLRNRPMDRIGAVVFGSDAFLLSPLTFDHQLISELVQDLEIGVAGDATAIGDGLGLSIKRLRDLDGDSKAIILLTDGANNAGQVNPLQAAQIARRLGITIHTIGMGSDEPSIQRFPGDVFTSRQAVEPEYDEEMLKSIADLTGGIYFNAHSLEVLQEVYREIDKLETSATENFSSLMVEELFTQYAVAALFLYLLYLILVNSVFMKLP